MALKPLNGNHFGSTIKNKPFMVSDDGNQQPSCTCTAVKPIFFLEYCVNLLLLYYIYLLCIFIRVLHFLMYYYIVVSLDWYGWE